MQMPMGIHKGRPIKDLPTAYLAWAISQDAIRFKRWSLIEEILRVLGERFGDLDKLKAELRVTEPPPPARWKTAEREAERKAEKAAKLAALEEQRRVYREAQFKDVKDTILRRLGRPPTAATEPPPGVWKDASYFAREARLAAQRGDDVSDLI